MLNRLVWFMIVLALAIQVIALMVWGHRTYLWVQGVEALAAGMMLLAASMYFHHYRHRASRWPPLLPLAGIAATGSAKDFCVASESETPIWLAVLLLLSVGWFLADSLLIWSKEKQSKKSS